MASDVGSLVRILNGYNDEQQRKQQQMKITDQVKSKVLITRDLLGGSCSSSSSSSSELGSKELDLDLQVPNGWEKRLDMKSGSIYIQRRSSPISSSSSSVHQNQQQQQQQKQSMMIHREIQDLNFPPSQSSIPKSKSPLTEESSDLKLFVVPSYDHQSSSVCTLDKVKSALERAKTESSSSSILKKRTLTISTTDNNNNNGIASSSSCSSSPSFNLINIKDQDQEQEDKKKLSSSRGVMFAAGCPGCLSYVLISKGNPKCPRCQCIVPSPSPSKKSRIIDLNLSV